MSPPARSETVARRFIPGSVAGGDQRAAGIPPIHMGIYSGIA